MSKTEDIKMTVAQYVRDHPDSKLSDIESGTGLSSTEVSLSIRDLKLNGLVTSGQGGQGWSVVIER